MPGSQLKEKMVKCLGQGQNQRDTETHTKANYQYIKETKIHTLQNSIISILKLHRQYRCLVIFDKLLLYFLFKQRQWR